MSWSPDGKWLALGGVSGAPSGIFLLPVDAGERRPLSNPKAPGYDSYPTFSPDGRRLAYAACTGTSSCDVCVQPLDLNYAARGEPRRITKQGLQQLTGLAWSRDGESLIYSSLLTSAFYSWRVKVRGEHPPERLDLAGPDAFRPAVAPAGNRLAFSRLLWNPDIWRYKLGGAPEPWIKSTLFEGPPILARWKQNRFLLRPIRRG